MEPEGIWKACIRNVTTKSAITMTTNSDCSNPSQLSCCLHGRVECCGSGAGAAPSAMSGWKRSAPCRYSGCAPGWCCASLVSRDACEGEEGSLIHFLRQQIAASQD